MVASVTPEYLRANGLWNPFAGTKKWQITCGDCGHTWKEKVPLRQISSAVCPCCRKQNKWDAEAFFRAYESTVKSSHPLTARQGFNGPLKNK